jgi:hypothetical protein
VDEDEEPQLAPEERRKLPAPGEKPDMPLYTRADLAKHAKMEDRVWVSYKDGVYDVTDFIEGHPGGQVCAGTLFICTPLLRILKDAKIRCN